MAKNPRIQFRCEDDTFVRWQGVVSRVGGTHDSVFNRVLDAYEERADAPASEEVPPVWKEFVIESEKLGVPLEAIIREALHTFRDRADPDGQGTQKIEAAARRVMALNARVHHWYERRALGVNLLFAETGSNQKSIRKWLDDNAAFVDAHHQAMGIDDAETFNRRAAHARRGNR